jgi:heme/copper-type cytochrome/quinol oxidase subunit 1
MQKESKHVIIEVIWLTGIFGLAALLLGKILLKDTIDIQLGDSYFVVQSVHVFLLISILLAFIVYFVRAFYNSFRRTLQNWILLIIGFILVIALTLLIKTVAQFHSGGWTFYPPLSALPPATEDIEIRQDPESAFILNFFTVLQAIVIAMLLFATFRWGKQTTQENNRVNP